MTKCLCREAFFPRSRFNAGGVDKKAILWHNVRIHYNKEVKRT